MANYVPKTAGEDSFELYNVVYSASKTEDLKDYFENRNSLSWTPYIKITEGDEYYFKALPKVNSKFSVDTLINNFKNEYGIADIYSFIQEKSFTIIIFNSKDIDSLLTKDIVVKQYETVYGVDTTDWKTDGIILYDTSVNETVYNTIENKKYFDFNVLKEDGKTEIFLCGYDIESDVLRNFSRCNENIHIFENNPFKINSIKSLIRPSDNVHFYMTRSYSKAYQAYKLFKDPIGNNKLNSNKAVSILKDYSDMITYSFESCDEWERLEHIKVWFEKKVSNSEWEINFIKYIFGETIEDLGFDSAESEKITENKEFNSLLTTSSYDWIDNTKILNTSSIPTYNQINNFFKNNSKYTKLFIFYKDASEFWTVIGFKVDRELNGGVSIYNALANDPTTKLQNTWYTENGIPVVKVENLYEILWYNINGKKPVPANYYEQNINGNYVFDTKTRQYLKFTWSTDKVPMVDGKKLTTALTVNNIYQTYILNTKYIIFDTVYPSKDIIESNKQSIYDIMRHKYVTQGNKFTAKAYLTDKQMYDCLKAKSILG